MKNTLGQFIAILRKANGLTQQDLADKLGVSNKAVSRWERDETAPDLFLIPAIAEIFGVSCDELLKGERIINETQSSYKNSSKQINALISKKLSQFKTLSIISVAISVAGFILFFGISYGYYKPILAFSIMLLFIIASLVITLISVSKLRDIKNDSETFALLDTKNQLLFNKTLADFSFFPLFIIFSSLFAIPIFVPGLDRYLALFLGFRSFSEYNIFTFLCLLFIYLYLKEPYFYFITNEKRVKIKNPIKTKLNIISLSFIGISALILIIAEFFNTHPYKMMPTFFILTILALLLLLLVIIVFIIFIVKYKKKNIIITGIKNILLIPISIIIGESHSTSFFDYYPAAPQLAEREDLWQNEYIGYAIIYLLIILTLYKIIEKVKKNYD